LEGNKSILGTYDVAGGGKDKRTIGTEVGDKKKKKKK
jgi:hypothetical protein